MTPASSILLGADIWVLLQNASRKDFKSSTERYAPCHLVMVPLNYSSCSNQRSSLDLLSTAVQDLGKESFVKQECCFSGSRKCCRSSICWITSSVACSMHLVFLWILSFCRIARLLLGSIYYEKEDSYFLCLEDMALLEWEMAPASNSNLIRSYHIGGRIEADARIDEMRKKLYKFVLEHVDSTVIAGQ
ncbi:hypothetical protein WN944_020742 [Citrus x changshan-huyou]|uniref:Uncharacterized protein n=1 Tax=Citrus x changshan-huyou TaxID=2935761 RepID=A0AAP0QGE1_9ROSI